MFLEPPTTQWDLRWQMFGVPVRVHPFFWLVSLVMGQNALRDGPQYLLAWVVCVFVSILIHEFGHVVMGMVCGSRGHIVLHAFGGLAIGSNNLSDRWQRIAVCLAGPVAGFVFLAAIFGLVLLRDPDDLVAYFGLAAGDLGFPYTDEAIDQILAIRAARPLELALASNLIFINLLWGLVNLLPVWPLDGGQISREFCDMASPGNGLSLSLKISVGVAGFIAVCSALEMTGRAILPVHFGSWYTAIMFGILAVQSYQQLQHVANERRWHDDRWDRDY